MRKTVVCALAYMLAGALVLVGLTGCPGRNAPPKPSVTPGATLPPGANIITMMTLDGVGTCPPGATYEFDGYVVDPAGHQQERPAFMTVAQFNEDGDPGTVRDARGNEHSGAAYSRAVRTPSVHCVIANPGDYVHVTVTWKIQTNAGGWMIQCVGYANLERRGRVRISGPSTGVVPAQGGTAEATCSVDGIFT